MKKSFVLIVLLFVFVNVHSQAYVLPFKYKGLWGLMNTAGREVLKPSFKEKLNRPETNGYVTIEDQPEIKKVNNKGLIDTSGKLLIPAEYQYVNKDYDNYLSAFKYEVICGSWNLIDLYNRQGTKIFKRSFNKVILNNIDGFKKFVLTEVNDSLSLFEIQEDTLNHRLLWSIDRAKSISSYFYRDTSIKLYYMVYMISMNEHVVLLKVFSDGKYELEKTVGPKIPSIGDAGIRDEAMFTTLEVSHIGEIVKAKNKGYFIIDRTRRVYDSLHVYDEISSCDLGYVVRLKNKWGVLDFQAKPIGSIEYKAVKVCNYIEEKKKRFVNFDKHPIQYVLVKKKKKWGVLSNKGQLVIPMEYDSILPLNPENFLAKKSNFWGVVNQENYIRIPFELKYINTRNDIPVCLLNGEDVIISGYHEGKLKLYARWKPFKSPELDSCKVVSSKLMLLYHNGLVGGVFLDNWVTFDVPFLHGEFTISDIALHLDKTYYWLETNDHQTGGYIRSDGWVVFKTD